MKILEFFTLDDICSSVMTLREKRYKTLMMLNHSYSRSLSNNLASSIDGYDSAISTMDKISDFVNETIPPLSELRFENPYCSATLFDHTVYCDKACTLDYAQEYLNEFIDERELSNVNGKYNKLLRLRYGKFSS